MATSHPPSLMAQAAALLATDPQAARHRADAVLRLSPQDPAARLIKASALRRLGDPQAAFAILAPLARAFPNAARTQYELGLVELATGHADAGAGALRRAVQLAPELTDAWQALGDHLFRLGDLAGAEKAFAELERHAVTDPALRPVADALFAGQLDRAEELVTAHLAKAPDDFDAVRMLGELRLKRGQWHEAAMVLGRGVALDNGHDGVRFSLALALFKRQSGVDALTQLAPLLARDAANPAYRNLHAAILALLGRDDEALQVYEGLLAEFTRHPAIWLNYGHALRSLRRRDDAIAAYRQAIAIAPQLGEAYWSLANLKTVALTAGEVATIREQLQRGDIGEEDRLHLHYALGKSLEDAGDHAQSFAQYATGGGLRLARHPHDAAAATALAGRIAAACPAALFAGGDGSGHELDAPIFVVGLPRAGSTLVEQILASHSAVEGTMELPDIAALAQEMGRFPEDLATLTAADRRRMGKEYLRRTATHRAVGKARFIDKMPNNFSYIGLIHLILPNSTIIDVRRQPMAAGFSAFRQLFAAGHNWSSDLVAAGRYYRDYVELMRHFDAVLPGRIHRVIYEDLVEDTEGEVRRMLAHCRLPFEAACLDFHRNDRAVRTVSSEQVRQPIFRDGLDQWRHYAPWLEPLRTALGPVADDWQN